MNSRLDSYIKKLELDFEKISESRKTRLLQLNNYLLHKLKNRQKTNLIFICTHNSRRSHLAQIWAATSINYYKLKNIKTFSGGTSITEFNKRVINILRKIGYKINNPIGNNPHYRVSFSKNISAAECFSKKYDSPFNPSKNFATIMTCSNAEKTCPLIPEAEETIFLPYNDPKLFDGTKEEKKSYEKSCEKIGTEMLFVMKSFQENRDDPF